MAYSPVIFLLPEGRGSPARFRIAVTILKTSFFGSRRNDFSAEAETTTL
jgi:hypothetical protein